MLSVFDEPDDEAATESEDSPQPLRLSKGGTLCLIAACCARKSWSTKANTETLSFATHDRITTAVLGDPQIGINPDVSEAVVDAILRTGWAAATSIPRAFDFGNVFNTYLQKLSALAATQSSPVLRQHSYLLTTHVLQSNSSSLARLSFIRDTLQFCPYRNLKEVSIGWLRDEYAKFSYTTQSRESKHNGATNANVLADSRALRDILTSLCEAGEPMSAETLFVNDTFYQAALSLVFVLCSSKNLPDTLDVATVLHEVKLEARLLTPLEELTRAQLDSQGQVESPSGNGPQVLAMLDLGLKRAREGMKQLNDRRQAAV